MWYDGWMRYCESWEPWTLVIVNSQTNPGTKYRVLIPLADDPVDEYTCNCLGYIHRGTCKHQLIAQEQVCHWNSKSEIEQTQEQLDAMICPKCGKGTFEVE